MDNKADSPGPLWMSGVHLTSSVQFIVRKINIGYFQAKHFIASKLFLSFYQGHQRHWDDDPPISDSEQWSPLLTTMTYIVSEKNQSWLFTTPEILGLFIIITWPSPSCDKYLLQIVSSVIIPKYFQYTMWFWQEFYKLVNSAKKKKQKYKQTKKTRTEIT